MYDRICLHLYLKVVVGLRRRKLAEVAKYIWFSCLLIPILAMVVMAILRDFGQSTGVPYGICFIKNTSTEYNQQRFGWIYPTIAISVFCFFLMCSIMYHVATTVFEKTKLAKGNEDTSAMEGSVSMNTTEEIEEKRVKDAWKKMLWLNQKTFSFVFVFVLLNTVAYVIILKLTKVDYDDLNDDIEGYVGCLLDVASNPTFVTSRAEARTVPQDVCGDPDDAVSIWSNLYYAVLWLQVCSELMWLYVMSYYVLCCFCS